MRCYVSQFITLIAQHNPVLEGCTGALGRRLCQDLLALVSSPWSPWSVASGPVVLTLNFDQSQTYLRSAMWDPLGAAVCAQADCDTGSSTALCLAAAACDRAGSLDSNSIIISPFKSSAFIRDYAQQWNLTITCGWRFLQSGVSLSLWPVSVFLSRPPSLAFCHLCEVYSSPLLPFPSTRGFGQEPATSVRQIFPGSPKAILQDSH